MRLGLEPVVPSLSVTHSRPGAGHAQRLERLIDARVTVRELDYDEDRSFIVMNEPSAPSVAVGRVTRDDAAALTGTARTLQPGRLLFFPTVLEIRDRVLRRETARLAGIEAARWCATHRCVRTIAVSIDDCATFSAFRALARAPACASGAAGGGHRWRLWYTQDQHQSRDRGPV